MLRLLNISLFNPLVYVIASSENNKISKGCKWCVECENKTSINICNISHLFINFQLIWLEWLFIINRCLFNHTLSHIYQSKILFN